MNLPEEAPKLPCLPFLIGDGVLIATAVFIGRTCETPIGPWPLLAITICVVLGAVLCSIPFIVNYTKRQDAELTERQNQISALARTTSESAEQLSIAAASLHGIAEASSANLKLIEQLPAQLQEHIKGLQKQLADTAKMTASAKDEGPRIDAAADRIAQTVADLTKLEAATRVHLTTANEALAQLPLLVEKASSKAGKQLTESATAAFLEAKTQALADFELHLIAAVTRAVAQAPEHSPAADTSRRKRTKPAHEEAPAADETTAVKASPVPEPLPPTAALEATPTSPEESSPAPATAPAVATEETLSAPAEPSLDEVPVSAPLKPPIRQPKSVVDPGPDLGLSVESPEAESAISSDGFTRLIATAYIGIGNKLFIRGEGPGLSWDKGIPLQFVSIGKWRWETADATTPVKAKLYKNDQTECTAVGLITLEPGHQHDVNAGF
ncbi:MAG TPA: hypothetical protein VL357_13505 [Rariglobus sp.]|jgi:hypothetical protein|nr:hypothetical protein [Rariglobus sp.]